LELKKERYFISFDETINNDDVKGFAIDVLPDGNDPMVKKGKACILFMSEEKDQKVKDEEDNKFYAHEPWGYIEFKDKENLELAQTALELLQMAIGREAEEK